MLICGVRLNALQSLALPRLTVFYIVALPGFMVIKLGRKTTVNLARRCDDDVFVFHKACPSPCYD